MRAGPVARCQPGSLCTLTAACHHAQRAPATMSSRAVPSALHLASSRTPSGAGTTRAFGTPLLTPLPGLFPCLGWVSTRPKAGEQAPHRRRQHLTLLTYQRARDRGPDAADSCGTRGTGADVGPCVRDGDLLSPREWNAIPKSPVSPGPTPNSRRPHVTPTPSLTDMLRVTTLHTRATRCQHLDARQLYLGRPSG